MRQKESYHEYNERLSNQLECLGKKLKQTKFEEYELTYRLRIILEDLVAYHRVIELFSHFR